MQLFMAKEKCITTNKCNVELFTTWSELQWIARK